MKKKNIFLVCSFMFSFFSFAQVNYLPGVTVSTYAGSSADPYAKDGQGQFAGFNSPYGVAIDATGTMYVADYQHNSIRKITPGGYVTTLAGSVTSGSSDGQGILAKFKNPQGIAVDAAGNVYVCDTGNHKIRKITPQGYVSTFAGTGTSGSLNGQVTTARFSSPMGLCIDASGVIYVADGANQLIRKIALDGTVSTIAGLATVSGSSDGQGSSARFNMPYGITVDASGTLYVADKYNHSIRKITPSGLVSTLAGSTTIGSGDGQGAAAGFYQPTGVAVDVSGNVYVADGFNNQIRKITSTGLVSTWAGSTNYGNNDGIGSAASFNVPTGLSIDASGNVYVADAYNREIRKISPSAVVTTIAGVPAPQGINGPISLAFFSFADGIVVDASNNTYVADWGMFQIRKISSDGFVTTFAGGNHSGVTDGQGSEAFFRRPAGMAKDATGNIYVTDSDANMIRKITPGGLVSTLAGSPTQGSANGQGTAAKFWNPSGIAVDGLGNVYVSDQYNDLIRKITPTGLVSTFAGSSQGFADGTGSAAKFSHPRGIAIDASNNLYVVDKDNNRIRKITPNGVVTTIAGNGSYSSIDADQGFLASFSSPHGIAIDAQGNIYVSEFGERIRRITPSGVVSTVAGSTQGEVDGEGAIATFYNPYGIAFDPSGNLLVVDGVNKKIRKIKLPSLTTDNQDKNISVKMQLFPNPAKEVITVVLPTGVCGTLNILDLQGQIIFSQIVYEKEILSTATLPNGMYILNVTSDEFVYTQNLVISK